MKIPKIALLHYSAPPVIGGVENVMLAHVRLFAEAGFPTLVVAGRGQKDALPTRAEFVHIPELDNQYPPIMEMSQELERGLVPAQFEEVVSRLVDQLSPVLTLIDVLIVHNVFTKHFNLPLTAALFRLLDRKAIRRCIVWCHDITWTSPSSRSKLHPGHPWELLRIYRPDVTYVAVSQQRRRELADLFGCPSGRIHVIYNGVDPSELLALSDVGLALINRLNLWDSDLNLLMPVRVTQAKNIELALRAVAALKKRGIQPKLVVTGPPDPHDRMSTEYFQSLIRLREQLGVSDQMRFVYESGHTPTEPFVVDMSVVSELFRVSDALFMPSHREGFGMPVLEAELVGIPIFCSETIPAAKEIGGQDVVRFAPEADPDQVASLILRHVQDSSVLRSRRRIWQHLTWRSIFRRKILSLLKGVAA